MSGRNLATIGWLNLFFILSLLRAQSSDLVDIYNNEAYYLKIDGGFIKGTRIIGVNATSEFTVAQSGLLGLRVQEDFFQDLPHAITEISRLKVANRHHVLAKGTSTILLALSLHSFVRPVFDSTINFQKSFHRALLFYWGAIGSANHVRVARIKSLNYLYRAMHKYNLSRLERLLTPEVSDAFEARSMIRVIPLFGDSQLVVNNGLYDLPRFLHPAPDTDRLFEDVELASTAYRTFRHKRQLATHRNFQALGVMVGTLLLDIFGPVDNPLVLVGAGTSLYLAVQSGNSANQANNYLNVAVYLYNQKLLEEIASGG